MNDFFWWTDAHRELQADVSKTVDELLRPSAERDIARKCFPREAVAEVGKRGWFGALVPNQYGGNADKWGVTGCAIICEELSRAGTLVMPYGTTAFGAVTQIVHNGTDAQKERWLPKLAKGELLGAITMTEPYAGSDIASIETAAVRDGDYYVVNGIKRFQSAAGAADLYMAYVKTSEDPGDRKKYKHLTGMIIEKGMEGFHVEQFNDWAGSEGGYNVYLRLDDVKVPVDNVIGGEGSGWRVMMSGVNVERTLNSAFYLGGLWEAIRYAKQHLERRVQFGQPTGSIPVNQFKLADLYAKLQMTRLLVYYAAHCADLGLEVPVEAAMAKLHGSEEGFNILRQAVQMMGGNGVMKNLYPTGRLLSDFKMHEIATGTNEIMRLLIYRFGESVFGPYLSPPVRAFDEELGVVLPVGKPPEKKVVESDDDVLKVLAENYRVNPGLHMTIDDMKIFLDVDDEKLVAHLESLEKEGLAGLYRDRKGRVRMAKATIVGIKSANPPEYYKRIPDWVAPEDAF